MKYRWLVLLALLAPVAVGGSLFAFVITALCAESSCLGAIAGAAALGGVIGGFIGGIAGGLASPATTHWELLFERSQNHDSPGRLAFHASYRFRSVMTGFAFSSG